MTDNEIVKELERRKHGFSPISKIYKNLTDAINLINRQKVEISKLQSDQYAIDKFARDLCKERMLKGKAIADFEDLQDYIKKEKTEAIREFANRLKSGVSIASGIITCDDIDNLVKEMTEESNDQQKT